MIALLISIVLAAAPLTPQGNHYGWRNKKTVPQPQRPPVVTVVAAPGSNGGGGQGVADPDAPTSRRIAD